MSFRFSIGHFWLAVSLYAWRWDIDEIVYYEFLVGYGQSQRGWYSYVIGTK